MQSTVHNDQNSKTKKSLRHGFSAVAQFSVYQEHLCIIWQNVFGFTKTAHFMLLQYSMLAESGLSEDVGKIPPPGNLRVSLGLAYPCKVLNRFVTIKAFRFPKACESSFGILFVSISPPPPPPSHTIFFFRATMLQENKII